MNSRERILGREQAMAYSPPVSGSPIHQALAILNLRDVKPTERVVDLASGASGLTAHLLNEGVDAYGVDKLYSEDNQVLTEEVNRYRCWVETTYGLYYPHHVPLITRSLDEFHISFQTKPKRYMGGWLTHLPLPSNFGNRIVSYCGLLELAEDEEVLEAAWNEAIRITEPEGSIVAAPLYSAWGDPNYYRSQHDRLIEELCRQNRGMVQIEEYDIDGIKGQKIRFTKNSLFE